MLYHINALLNDLDIRYVIGEGNLLENERGIPIYHDDDLDIRMDIDDLEKWKNYCEQHDSNAAGYNLKFDFRFYDLDKQLQNGLQASLITFNNYDDIQEFDRLFFPMDLHMDIVFSAVRSSDWVDYDINFDDLRETQYLGVDTYAPNDYDTDLVLKKAYGAIYMVPDYIPYEIY